MQTDEYAVKHDVDREPDFNWWVSHVPKRRDRNISKVKLWQKRFIESNEKYVIEIPRNIAHSCKLDKQIKNTLWADAIAKEMKNVSVAFDIKDAGVEKDPIGYQEYDAMGSSM